MKKIYKIILSIIMAAAVTITINLCSTRDKTVSSAVTIEIIESNVTGKGISLQVELIKGVSYNHPLMAIWIEDTGGNFIQTLFVANSIGKGVFKHGDKSTGKWLPGPIRRPAALPYWGHKRGIQAPDGYYLPTPEEPVPDAYTGATPEGSFLLNTHTDDPGLKIFRVLFEINQSWDWNEYWTNNKFPDDAEYKTSSQPALVYEAWVDLKSNTKVHQMILIGRSHHNGDDGKLYTDLNTMTTARDIAKSISVIIQ